MFIYTSNFCVAMCVHVYSVAPSFKSMCCEYNAIHGKAHGMEVLKKKCFSFSKFIYRSIKKRSKLRNKRYMKCSQNFVVILYMS